MYEMALGTTITRARATARARASFTNSTTNIAFEHMTHTDKFDRLVQSFGARSCTPTEFNNLLIEIIGLASQQFCREKQAHGMSRAAINIELVDSIQKQDRWRATTLQEFLRLRGA